MKKRLTSRSGRATDLHTLSTLRSLDNIRERSTGVSPGPSCRIGRSVVAIEKELRVEGELRRGAEGRWKGEGSSWEEEEGDGESWKIERREEWSCGCTMN